MTATSEDSGAQQAFVGLLARPLVTPSADPELHRQLVTHRKQMAEFARRLGYRVQVVGRVIRLHRVPIGGRVAAPTAPLDAPPRRVLALVCCLAAACEQSDGTVTLQQLSDLVRDTTLAPASTVSPYDPDSHAERRRLVKAADQLETWGVLHRRTGSESLVTEWADTRTGIGAGYDVDRDALLLLTSPDVLASVDRVDDSAGSSPAVQVMRQLVETPAVLYSELDPDDAETLRATRGLRSADATAMTGGVVEARREGLVLLLPGAVGPGTTTVDWPKANTASWVALLAADAAGRGGAKQPDGSVLLDDEGVAAVIAELIAEHGSYLTKTLQDNPSGVRAEAQQQLQFLGLLSVEADGSWRLSPIAGRYRAPVLTTIAPPEQPGLFDEPA